MSGVCECQLAESRPIASVWKRDEQGKFVVERGGLELLLARVSSFEHLFASSKRSINSASLASTLALRSSTHIFENVLAGLLDLRPARQALALVRVDLGHQLFVHILDGDLSCNVDFLAD